MKLQLYKNLFKAYQGWWRWHKICKKYRLGNTAVILMPSEDRDNNFHALLYLDELLKRRGWEDAVVLSCDEVSVKSAEYLAKNLKKAAYISRKHAEQIMQYYCLYEFDSRLIVASLDEPSGRNASSLIGKKGVTVEELVAIGIYKIIPFERITVPKYKGDDKEIKNFLFPKGGITK